MYDELMKRLRVCPNYTEACVSCPHEHELGCRTKTMHEAADAIEELSKDLDSMNEANIALYGALPKWIKIESRPMTEEERKEWSEHIGYDIEYENAIIYTSKLPDDGEEVLVCNKYGHIWLDTFDNDPDYGVGFETNGDMDGIVAWMPKPKPYEPPKEE